MNFQAYYNLNEAEAHRHQLTNWKQLTQDNPELAAAVELLSEIEALEPHSEALIVGGSARDLLMGRKIHDVDIATNVDMGKIVKHFKTADIGASKDFGLVVVIYKGFHYEVAHYREDGAYLDARRPDEVNLINTFEGDSARRDFTVNSLGLTKDGVVVDYQGGLKDIKQGLMRAVGEPSKRFQEDALRIYRLFRFAAGLGFQIDPDTKKAALELVDMTDKLAKERVRDELFKAAANGPALANYIEHLDEMGLLKKELPEVYQMKSMPHDIDRHPESPNVFGHVMAGLREGKIHNPLHNIAFLLHDLGKNLTHTVSAVGRNQYLGHEAEGIGQIESIGKRLKLSNEQLDAIRFASLNHMKFHKLMEMRTAKVVALVNNPYWEVLKSVGYMDAVCRGQKHHWVAKFHETVAWAEGLAAKAAGGGAPSNDAMKKRLKSIIDGNSLMAKHPELKANRELLGKVIRELQEYVIENDAWDMPGADFDELVRFIIGELNDK